MELKLTELTNQLVSILHDSAEKAMNVVKTKKKKKKQLKHKPWWDKTMRDLHIRTCLAYIKYRDLDFSPTAKKEWEKAKKEFKKTRKFNQKLLRDKLLKQINELPS